MIQTRLTAGFAALLFSILLFAPCHAAGANGFSNLSPPYDTVKYQGYRLDITLFEVLKKTDDWVKVRLTVVNSGRFDIDFSKEGTEHWVQVNFDPSIFDAKMGGLRENIRRELAEKGFRLQAGKIAKDLEMKVPVVVPVQRKKDEPVVSTNDKNEEGAIAFSAKGGSDEITQPDEEALRKRKEECPDIAFSRLQIVSQDDKWATLEYTLVNKGKGVFQLQSDEEIQEPLLAVRAYISGVTTFSRGALPIGGQFISEGKSLEPGESHTGKLRLDIRKKTRYMKSLILSLESSQFADECDKTNNTGAVILD